MNNLRNRRPPDYKLLAMCAIVFNPLLGCIALATNDLAKRRHFCGERSSANFYYFVTILFSVFSIGSTITILSVMSMHLVLQEHLHVAKWKPNWWCKQEVDNLNITMRAGVSVDEFCDQRNENVWFFKIDKARQVEFLKKNSLGGAS